ncbi:hypothetical protein [Salinimicrobium sp. HB62]|uniref:hypothetical protein n=2 Tax=Flavobacteriaceae TaxID=49546 RepID=UPI002D783041|nr:hypothetical protein [Salinimicrobium sp. HB62]
MEKNKIKTFAITSQSFYLWQRFNKIGNMFEFDQYLGFLAFLIILLIGFWVMLFLTAIIPYWIGGAVKEMLDERKEKKRLEREKA